MAALAGCWATLPAQAATLEVGAGKPFPTIAKALAAAHDGDTILIAPGTYYQCAMIGKNNLTIAGSGAASTVLTDLPCAGKALLVIDGHDITVRDLTLARVRVPDGNGAGIRAEGGNLTVDHVHFVNDQDGILAAANPSNTLLVRDSLFRQTSLHGIDAGSLKLLRVIHSTFEQLSGGNHINSGAQATTLIDNQLRAAGVKGDGPLVFMSAGMLTLQGNTVTLGADQAGRPGVVLATGGVTRMELRNNTLQEPPGTAVPLLRNWTGQTVVAEGNTVPSDTVAVSDAGSTYHRIRAELASIRDSLHAAAGRAKHVVGVLIHRLR